MNTSRNLFTLFRSRVSSPNPSQFHRPHPQLRDRFLSFHHKAPRSPPGCKFSTEGGPSARVDGTRSLFHRAWKRVIDRLKFYKELSTKPDNVRIISFESPVILTIYSVTLTWVLWYHIDTDRAARVRSAFRTGVVPRPADFVLGRNELEAKLKSILQPPVECSDYDLVVGHQGTGKSALVRKVANECSGVIYVDLPVEIEKLDNAFADAIKWPLPVGGLPLTIMIAEFLKSEQLKQAGAMDFDQVFAEFVRHAEEFKKRCNQLAVLVFDNIRCRTKSDYERLQVLRGIAKKGIDNRQFKVVFVVTEEGKKVSESLGPQSGTGQLLTIGDLSPREATDYLCGHHMMSEAEALEIYDLVGGRLKFLTAAAGALKKTSFPAWKSSMLSFASKTFDNANMAVTGENRAVGLKISRRILECGPLPMHDYYLLVGNIELARHLLTLEIFSADPSTNTIDFNSQLIASYAKVEAAMETAKVAA